MRLRFILLSAMLLLLLGCTPAKPTFRSTDIGAVEWGADVSLLAHTGRRVSTADFRGKVLLLFFGYTHCADICTPTLSKLAAVRKTLGKDSDRVQVLLITVDPVRDTAATLAKFVPKFDASFIGLTGSDGEIAAVAREYKVPYVVSNQAGKHHHIPHSGNILVKDIDGKVRLMFREETSVADMAHDLQLLLRDD
jgi:protein SCO1